MSDREPLPVPEPSAQGDGDAGYDQRQVVDAVLVVCAVCGQAYYMTNPARTVCQRCRDITP